MFAENKTILSISPRAESLLSLCAIEKKKQIESFCILLLICLWQDQMQKRSTCILLI